MILYFAMVQLAFAIFVALACGLVLVLAGVYASIEESKVAPLGIREIRVKYDLCGALSQGKLDVPGYGCFHRLGQDFAEPPAA